jgi:hypothetical protein
VGQNLTLLLPIILMDTTNVVDEDSALHNALLDKKVSGERVLKRHCGRVGFVEANGSLGPVVLH